MEYEGIELVDPATRELQHRVVRSIWETLNESGIGTGATGRITGYFTANSKSAALALFKKYKAVEDGDFESTMRKKKNAKEWTVEILTSECHFTLGAFTELVDMYLIDAAYFEVKFNGLEVARSNVRVRKPWWRFW